MRSTASFAFHAILAACLAALAASSAAAAGYLKLGTVKGDGSSPASRGHEEEIEIHSVQWGTPARPGGATAGRVTGIATDPADANGPRTNGSYVLTTPRHTGVNKVEGFTVKQRVARQDPKAHGDWIADVERPAEQSTYAPANTKYPNVKMTRGSSVPRSGGSNAMRMEDAAGAERDAAGRGFPNAGGLKAEHEIVESPVDKGTVWVRVSSPWAACRVGDRYPSIELGDGAKSHLLEDVVVAGCSPDGASFYYRKVTVRGWDPERKEE